MELTKTCEGCSETNDTVKTVHSQDDEFGRMQVDLCKTCLFDGFKMFVSMFANQTIEELGDDETWISFYDSLHNHFNQEKK